MLRSWHPVSLFALFTRPLPLRPLPPAPSGTPRGAQPAGLRARGIDGPLDQLLEIVVGLLGGQFQVPVGHPK